jgi:hypothetical protein
MRVATLVAGAFCAGLACMVSACVQKVESRPQPAVSGSAVAPGLVLEQFLRAVNAAAANDTSGVTVMGRLFGTTEGSVNRVDEPRNVEQRMFLIASILRHDDYKILGEQIVPGRLNEARQINVEMAIGERKVTVPFTMVRTRADNWLVESVGVETLTAR